MSQMRSEDQTSWVIAHHDDVRLVVPPSSAYLRTIRMVAADTALRGGLDCDEIEDFRIAVDELSHTLMATTDQEVTIMFRVSGYRVAARGATKARQSSHRHVLDELSEKILRSVADFHSFDDDEDLASFVVIKQHRPVMVRQG